MSCDFSYVLDIFFYWKTNQTKPDQTLWFPWADSTVKNDGRWQADERAK